MNIHIETINHDKQRYPTVGDWYYDKDKTLQIRVSRIKGRPDMEALIVLHELVEAILCRDSKISEERVTQFDLGFKGDGEPGDDSSAPYYTQHRQATLLEKLFAQQLGIGWGEYEKRVNQLT